MTIFDALLSITIPLWQAILLVLISGGLLIVLILALIWYIDKIRKMKDRNNESVSILEGRPSQKDAEYDAFSWYISHEVIQPLAGIKGNLEMLSECDSDEVGRQNQLCRIMDGQITRLGNMLGNMSSFVSLISPNADIKLQRVNFKEVIDEVVLVYGDYAEFKGIKLNFNCPREVARIMGDKELLVQVMMNLVDNGIKYGKDSGGEITIDVQDTKKDKNLWVRVMDNGVGIDEDDLPYIFDFNYQAPILNISDRKGKGFGLALVKMIIEKHEGEIKVQSENGVGTKVSFNIPLIA